MSSLCIGQDFPELQFDHITAKEGLSSNVANCITEDQSGFIWIGTTNGLNRYDGYRFKHYFHSAADSNSLINNNVQRLYTDSKGRLWMSTEDGVSCFLPAENRFVNFNTKLNPPRHLKVNGSTGFYEDEQGMIWLCNQEDVIYRVLPDLTLQEVKLQLPEFIFYDQMPKGYDQIYRDQQGNEWAFKANRIYKVNKLTKQAEQIFNFPELIKNQVLKMLQEQDGKYFISTWKNGIFRFFPDRNVLEPIESIPDHFFPDMAEWSYKQRHWIIFMDGNSGLYLIDPNRLHVRQYGFVPGDPSAIQGSLFNASYIDKRKNLWICSNAGIQKITAEQKLFDILPVTETGSVNYQNQNSGSVYSFLESDSSIWISKRFVSTLEYDTTFHLNKFYYSLSPLSSSTLSSTGYAYYFYQDKNDLYITTDSGLVMIDLVKEKSYVFSPPGTFTYSNFRTIIPFSAEELMIRSYDRGLFVFNSREKRYTKTFDNSDTCHSCLPQKLNYLFKSIENQIFVTADQPGKSLFRYHPDSSEFHPVIAENEGTYHLLANNLFGMAEDEHGYLWIAGTSGVFIYDPKTNTILEQINDNDQIGGLTRICFDNEGNAWANGNSGIWCYLKARKKWIGFNNEDGLPGSQFDGIIVKRKNGDIIAGLEGAIAIFHPNQLTQQPSGFPVMITEAMSGEHPVSFPLLSGMNKTLNIPPGVSFFSVDFAMLNYLSPTSSRYYYQLKPLMKDFRVNDDGHINFNGLAPGDYTLYVRGGDKAGNIFLPEDHMSIVVKPKWYQTISFKLICIFLFAGALYYFLKRRISSIRQQAALQQKIAKTEMQALRAQMNPHFIFNSLNSIENFIMQNEKRLASDYLNKFARLIRIILDSSRQEMVLIAKDMEALRLYIELEQLRFNNKFCYQSDIDPELIHGDYKVPPLLIQPYVENAIVHGIAHSDKSDLQLLVQATLEGDVIRYVIQDNGVGRKRSAEYNTRNKPGHQSVGLQITRDRILNFNQKQMVHDAISITDLYDDQHQPSGTKVEVRIKSA